jgi:hypothetical protein
MKKTVTLLITLMLSIPAMAADFVFSVPVKLERIPKGIPQAKVICEIFTYRDTQNPVASGYTIRPIDSRQGLLVEDITVAVNFHPQQRHQLPHQYRCQLMLLVPWTQPNWQMPAEHAVIEDLQPKAQTGLVTEVSGLIPGAR